MEPTQGTRRVVDTKVQVHLSSDAVLPTWCLCVLGYCWWPGESPMVHSSRGFLSWPWPRGAWSHRQTDAVYYHRKDRPSQNDRYFSFSLAWPNNKALSLSASKTSQASCHFLPLAYVQLVWDPVSSHQSVCLSDICHRLKEDYSIFEGEQSKPVKVHSKTFKSSTKSDLSTWKNFPTVI